MPARYIRERLLDSKRYHKVGLIERLAFIELLLLADDFGLVQLDPVFLSRRTTAFAGLGHQAMEAKIDAMEKEDLIRTYVVQAEAFGFIPRNGFFRRAKRPAHPLPDFDTPENNNRFNELKKLCGICIADALHVQRTRTADVLHMQTPPSSSPTPTPSSQPEIPGLSNEPIISQVWTFGVELLKRDGKKPLEDAAARSFIGSMMKGWDAEDVLDACQAAVGTDDPKAYIRAVLRKKPKSGERDEEHWD
jgi:hypothetical protein